jgi:glycosyltransferase involved in cell wall biosynthesis
MRVLHTLDLLSRGGVQMLELDVCRNARANGLELIFVATAGGDLEDEFRRSGVEFIRLQRKLPVDPNLVLKLRKIIKERNIQVVHSHQAVEGLHTYLATLGTKVKGVLSFHGGIILDAKNKWALKFLIPRMNANIAVSQELLKYLQTEEGLDTSKNFYVVRNGVDAKRLQPTGRSLRNELGVTEDQLLFSMIANFYSDPRKDQMTVCKALRIVFSQVPNLHFAFVGGFSEPTPQMYIDCVNYCHEHNIANRIHFLGKRSDIADVLNSLDAFVLSSLHEGLPISVIEALIMGIPTVVSDIGPMIEVSGDGAYALVFRAGDPNDLARNLTRLVNDAAYRKQLGAKARQWALQEFGIEAYISKLIRLYGELMGA